MAIYSTFFLCEPELLPVGFPGWKPPLPELVTRVVTNPFTREPMTIQTDAPEWDDFDPDDRKMPEYRVVSGKGDYNAYLEQRIPAFVQSQPHWCAKNLTCVELEPLVSITNGVDHTRFDSPLFAPPSLSSMIDQFPEDFVAQLKAADVARLRDLAGKWAAQMSTPEFTHSGSGKRVSDDWSVDDALEILNPIAELAKRQVAGQAMYLFWE